MKKYFLVALALLPLTVGATNVLKESIKMKRKYDHDKHRITNTINHTKRNIKEITLEVCEAGIRESVKLMEEAIANGATLEDFLPKKEVEA